MATLDDIGGVGSLFGLTPSSLNAQREQQYMDFASKVANAEAIRPGTGSVLGANVMGARGVQQLGSMFGIESPEDKLAKLRQAAMQQFDTNTPEGLAQVAQFLNQQGDAAGARQAIMAAQAQQQKIANLQRTQAQTQQAEAGKVIQVDLGDRIQLVNALTREVIREIPKGLTPAQAAKARAGGGEGGIGGLSTKPLSASLQKSEDKDLEAVDTYTAQAEALKPSIDNLTPNEEGVRKLELGPAKNAMYIAQNALGNSTPESRAYAGLKSAVDTAVNLQVSAEKGVQTDKDVLRFANALIAAYGRNDTQATLEALKRYNEALEKAKNRTSQRIDQRRISQKVEPLFGGQQASQTTKPTGEKKTRTLKSGLVVTIED